MLTIDPIRAFSDNYIWLLSDPDSREAYVVDPGDAAPVLKRLKQDGLHLKGVLITHWHPDHIGGLEALQQAHEFALRIVGPESPQIQRINETVREGSTLDVLGREFTVWEVPGHTLDHIAYVCQQPPQVFCGDTLFAAGCGRMFEGNPEQMHHSLQRFLELADETQLYCAHEYTLNNLKFARAAEPDNMAIVERLQKVEEMRRRDEVTVPSQLGIEKQTNPFLRVESSESIIHTLNERGFKTEMPWQTFAGLRAWKDNF